MATPLTPTQKRSQGLMQQVIAVLERDHGIKPEDFARIHETFPQLGKLAWQDMTWEVGQPMPGEPWIIFDGFEGDAYDPGHDQVVGDVRIYCMPTPELQRAGAPYFRLKLNRAHPTATRFWLTEQGFIDELAHEWAKVVGMIRGQATEEPDLGTYCETCELYTKTNPDEDTDTDADDYEEPEAKFCSQCGTAFPADAPDESP